MFSLLLEINFNMSCIHVTCFITFLVAVKQKFLLPPWLFYSKSEEKTNQKNPHKQRIQISQPVLLPVTETAYKGSPHEETKMHWENYSPASLTTRWALQNYLTGEFNLSANKTKSFIERSILVSPWQFILLQKHRLNWKEEFILTCSEKILDFLFLVNNSVIFYMFSSQDPKHFNW